MDSTNFEVTPMVAWHNDAELKQRAVAEMIDSVVSDRIKQGSYFTTPINDFGAEPEDPTWSDGVTTDADWRGCFHGCLVAARLLNSGLDIGEIWHVHDWHARTAQMFGIPDFLGSILDMSFEHQQSLHGAGDFAVKTLEAIPVGADLGQFGHRVAKVLVLREDVGVASWGCDQIGLPIWWGDLKRAVEADDTTAFGDLRATVRAWTQEIVADTRDRVTRTPALVPNSVDPVNYRWYAEEMEYLVGRVLACLATTQEEGEWGGGEVIGSAFALSERVWKACEIEGNDVDNGANPAIYAALAACEAPATQEA